MSSHSIRGSRRAVFLDRDGVINRARVQNGKPYPPANVAELEIVPDAADALADLKRHGFLLIVVTNQPDVARGSQRRDTVEQIHQVLASALPLDQILVCYHSGEDRCDCRKPSPGLLIQAAREHQIDLTQSFMVGDRWRDIDAGYSAGCMTVMIDYAYQEQGPLQEPNKRVISLREAVNWIIGQNSRERTVSSVSDLKVKIFGDGADKTTILDLYGKPYIKGFTTNPTLMRKAGLTDYEAFAHDVLQTVRDRPISFEVFADEFPEMERQARKIATWGGNVYVKIPVTNTRRESSLDLIAKLAQERIQLNITAIMTLDQIRDVCAALKGGAPACVSLFAGRVADTGRDPVPLMSAAVEIVRMYPNVELIWASPRELLNIFQADAIGCDIITVTNDILQKLALVGKDLHDYSLDTVKMFHQDAMKSGFTL